MKKLIQSTDYSGAICTLVYEATGEAVYVGDVRGEETITGGRAPHKPSSTGRVYIDFQGTKGEFFPGVVGAKWARADNDRTETLGDRYNIYVACVGKANAKTFDEWLNT